AFLNRNGTCAVGILRVFRNCLENLLASKITCQANFERANLDFSDPRSSHRENFRAWTPGVNGLERSIYTLRKHFFECRLRFNSARYLLNVENYQRSRIFDADLTKKNSPRDIFSHLHLRSRGYSS